MAQYAATIVVPVPITEVFDYLARFDHCAEWDPGVDEAEMLTPAPVGLGSAFRVVARFAGRPVPLRYEITRYERPEQVRVRAENGSTISEDTITLTAEDGHTTVRYDADLQLKGPFRLFAPVLGLLFTRIGDRAARGLRAALCDRDVREER